MAHTLGILGHFSVHGSSVGEAYRSKPESFEHFELVPGMRIRDGITYIVRSRAQSNQKRDYESGSTFHGQHSCVRRRRLHALAVVRGEGAGIRPWEPAESPAGARVTAMSWDGNYSQCRTQLRIQPAWEKVRLFGSYNLACNKRQELFRGASGKVSSCLLVPPI